MKVFTVASPSVKVESVEFAPNNTLFVIGASGGGVGPWECQSCQLACPEQPPAFRTGTSATFHPHGRWLVGTNCTDGLAVYNLDTNETLPGPGSHQIVYSRFTPDGKFLVYSYATTSGRCGLLCREWMPDRVSKAIWSIPTNTIRGLATLADRNRIATVECVGDRGQVSLRDVQTGNVLATQTLDGSDHLRLAVAPDDSLLVTLTRRHLRVCTTTLKQEDHITTVSNDGRKHFTDIAFHPCGRYLAATSNDETVKLYSTATWQEAKRFTWEIGKMRSIAFSPDGTLAAAGSDIGKVVVWDVDV